MVAFLSVTASNGAMLLSGTIATSIIITAFPSGFVGLAEIGSGAQRPRRMIFKIDETDLEASRSSGWGGLNGGW